jgi:hypothetical protein
VWGRLLDLEAQLQRRPRPWPRPRKRPSEPADKMLADEVIKRVEAAYPSETDGLRVTLEELTASAKKERAELTSSVVQNGVRREERVISVASPDSKPAPGSKRTASMAPRPRDRRAARAPCRRGGVL